MIEIYGKTACAHCDAAKKLCEMKNIEYTYKQLDKDFTRDEVLELFPGARTFPQIKVNGNSIGGYDNLTKYLEETNYNGTGHTL